MKVIGNILIVILTIFITVVTVFATQQLPDTIIYEKQVYGIDGGKPLILEKLTQRPLVIRDTGHYRGWAAEYEIKDNQLYLNSLQALEQGKELLISDIFPSKKALPTKADWYSGEVVVMLSGLSPDGFVDVLILKIEKGDIVNKEKMKEKYEPD